MGFQSRQETYFRLIGKFLSSEVGGDEFCREFMGMWREDRDEEYARRELWSERYDLQLIEAHNRLEISPAEFSRKWAELWGYADSEPLHRMLDQIFSACDAFSPNPKGAYEINEEQLRREAQACVAGYKSGKSYRDG